MEQHFFVDKILVGDIWLHHQEVVLADGKITAIRPSANDESSALTMIPGFIDLQVNGGGGRLFNRETDIQTLIDMTQSHRQFGTTAMLPTLITDQFSVMQQSAEVIAQAMAEELPGILGVHFEGPFLSKDKKGIHPQDCIRSISDKELALLTRQDLGKVLVTLAPENVPTDIIAELVQHGVKVCLGHSNASYDQAIAAIEAGADGFTHLYNAMSAMTSREPGMVGAALTRSDTFAGLIVDHQHVHPQMSELAINSKGENNIFLVTDAMGHVGYESHELPYFDTIITRHDNKLTVPDGTLAGSCLDMLQAVNNVNQDLGFSLEQAIMMASSSPAHYLGVADKLGQLHPGMQADFILTDSHMKIESVYVAGQPLFNRALLNQRGTKP